MLNKILVHQLNKDKLNDSFNAFEVKKTDDSTVIKADEALIYSVSYTDANLFYVLTSANTTKKDMYRIFPSNHYFIRDISTAELSDKALITLIMNKQANKSLEFNNLSPDLCCIREKKRNQFVTLSFSVDDDLILSCKVKTFSMLNDKTISKFTGKTRKSIEQGKLSAYEQNGDYIVRKINYSQDGYYINRTFRSSGKNTVQYFAIDSSDHKTAEMFRLIRRINNEEAAYLKLSFADLEYTRILEEKRLQKDIYSEILRKLPEDMIVNVIDNCDQQEKISRLIERARIKYVFSNALNKSCLNLSVVKNKKEYDDLEEKDKYFKSAEYIIQNIEYRHLNETVLKQCLLEFVVKREAVDKTVYVVDMPGEWKFYQIINKVVHCLSITDNKILGVSSFDIPENINERMRKYSSRNPRIIMHASKMITILDSDIRLMPDWNEYVQQKEEYTDMISGKPVNRARKQRNRLFGEIIDVNSFSYNVRSFYSVGEIGYGMNKSISNSPATKEII